MIRLQGISKSYTVRGERQCLFANLDLEIPAGRCVGVLGPRGSGKTTLLKLCCGLEQADRGSIDTGGRISIPLGHSPGLSPPLSGRENTAFVARVLGLDVAYLVDRVQQLADLGYMFDHPIGSYERLMRVRLSFSIVLAADYDWYLADEQLAVKEGRHRDRFMGYFEELKQHKSILMASTKPKLLRKHCDSVIIVNNNTAAFYDSLEEGLARHRERLRQFAKKRSLRKSACKQTDKPPGKSEAEQGIYPAIQSGKIAPTPTHPDNGKLPYLYR